MTNVVNKNTVVRVRGGSSTKVVLSPSVVQRINAIRPVSAAPASPEVNVTPRPNAVVLGGLGRTGPKGDKGDTGASAVGVPPIAFSYGDAPGAIWTADAAGTITGVRLLVATPFDGVGATIALGRSAGAVDAIMTTDQNYPGMASEYENTPDVHLAAGEAVTILIVPGTSGTQGAGTIYLSFLPD